MIDLGKHERTLAEAKEMHQSLLNAIHMAGGHVPDDELFHMTVLELEMVLGMNNIRFIYMGRDN